MAIETVMYEESPIKKRELKKVTHRVVNNSWSDIEGFFESLEWAYLAKQFRNKINKTISKKKGSEWEGSYRNEANSLKKRHKPLLVSH